MKGLKMESLIKIEITDTFGGEANYCFVNKMELKNKGQTIRKILKDIRRKFGISCKLRKQWDDGQTIRYNFDGQCFCMFITFE